MRVMVRPAAPKKGAEGRLLAHGSEGRHGGSGTNGSTAVITPSYEISAADLEASKWLEYTIEKGLLAGVLGEDRPQRSATR